MSQRSNIINLFWTLMAIVAVGAVVLGGYVAWKLVYSTTPKIERANMDPEQLLERTIDARQEETQKIQSGESQDISIPVPDSNDTTRIALGNVAKQSDEDYYDEDEEFYDEEGDDVQADATENDAKQNATDKDPFSYTLEDVDTPAKPAKSAVQSKPVAPQKPKIREASYAQGLQQCLTETVFPCSWKDSSNGSLTKWYWLRGKQGPIERIIFTSNGKIISQTFATVGGQVTRYQDNFAELYFENGLLTKIRTFPYDNPNLRDWFLIGPNGKISACLCGVPTKDCCSRSFWYREGGPRNYCALFPVDTDFCAKSRA